MLFPIDRLKTYAADKPPKLEKEYVNPESIERVRESGTFDGEPCVDVLVRGEWVRCLGTVQEVGHAVNEMAQAYASWQPE